MLTELLLQRPSLEAIQQARRLPPGRDGSARGVGDSRRAEGGPDFGPDYEVRISSEARKAAAQSLDQPELAPMGAKDSQSTGELKEPQDSDGADSSPKAEDGEVAGTESTGQKELSDEEKAQVDKLEKRDREVRAHEQAHLSAAGGYARGGIHLEFETGPDNKRYAVGGHVNLDTGKENTPEATLQKAQVIRKAALAPANPSSQDRQVAAQAAQMAQEAQRELMEERTEKSQGNSEISGSQSTSPDTEESPKDEGLQLGSKSAADTWSNAEQEDGFGLPAVKIPAEYGRSADSYAGGTGVSRLRSWVA